MAASRASLAGPLVVLVIILAASGSPARAAQGGNNADMEPMRGSTRRQLIASNSSAVSHHGGRVFNNPISINIVWYGPDWTAAQKVIILDFFSSVSAPASAGDPQVKSWWNIARQYYNSKGAYVTGLVTQGWQYNDTGSSGLINVAPQTILTNVLKRQGIKNPDIFALHLILTSRNVTVKDPLAGTFCKDYCAFHSKMNINGSDTIFSFVGNADTQCPGQCSQDYTSAPSPNSDKGVDAMISLLGGQLSATASDADMNAWFDQNGKEGNDLCQYTYGSLLTASNGASYNLNGINNRKFAVQQMYNPTTAQCASTA
eukprot:SM000005S17177  [mRNA]  locus=s5:669605:672011:+ [translate_table: standard]